MEFRVCSYLVAISLCALVTLSQCAILLPQKLSQSSGEVVGAPPMADPTLNTGNINTQGDNIAPPLGGGSSDSSSDEDSGSLDVNSNSGPTIVNDYDTPTLSGSGDGSPIANTPLNGNGNIVPNDPSQSSGEVVSLDLPPNSPPGGLLMPPETKEFHARIQEGKSGSGAGSSFMLAMTLIVIASMTVGGTVYLIRKRRAANADFQRLDA